jgi:hypothetical protein
VVFDINSHRVARLSSRRSAPLSSFQSDSRKLTQDRSLIPSSTMVRCSSYLGEFVLCFAQNDGLVDSEFTKDLTLGPTNLDLQD